MKKEDCLFEITYIKHEEEILKNSDTVAKRRIYIGRLLGKKHPVDADYVIPMPETAVFNAIGYHLETGIPYCLGIYKTRPKVKTLFINNRESVIQQSMVPIPYIITNKKLVIVDETIISGLTLKTCIEKIKKFTPKEIHLRIVIEPMLRPCPSSDFGNSWNYIRNESIDLCDYFSVDSIEYLSHEDFKNSVKCSFCFGGKDDNSKMVETAI